jgi:hypothetical protein
MENEQRPGKCLGRCSFHYLFVTYRVARFRIAKAAIPSVMNMNP